jgi:hypothetical protein
MNEQKVLELLDEIRKEILELKDIINTRNKTNSTPTTKITVIGNRPQKTMKVKGVDSDEDFTL